MSKKAAEHHKKASEHATRAARHHGEAAKHHEAGHHEKDIMHIQREPTSFTPEGTLKRQRKFTPRSTARNSIVAARI